MINIKPSAAIRNNYNEISKLCKESGGPVYLTKNGEGDLVVMDIESFSERENMLRLREQLLRVEEDRMNGIEDLTLEETAKILKSAMEETEKTIHHV